MIQNKTRIRTTWFVLITSAITILFGFILKMEAVIMSALGTISLVGMTYIGGKTLNNQKKTP